jgi:very-short-patch-repair endonuclease
MRPIPDELVGRPFTSAMAISSGIHKQALSGRRFQRVFRGVYVTAGTPMTLQNLIRAALLTLPYDAVVSHTTAMALYGLTHRRHAARVEFSTNTTAISAHEGICLHRRRSKLHPRYRDDLPVTGPDRTFVDCATRLSLVELVQLGDFLIQHGYTTLDTLTSYVHNRHLDGVRRARRCVALVRERAESPRETLLRLMLRFARLPEPEVNIELHDADGSFVARLDLAYRRWRVAVEYDGQHHERDERQRQRDRERREAIEALGWRVIIVTSRDLVSPRSVPWRVYNALAARGYAGRSPVLNDTWHGWFSGAAAM